MKKIKCSLCRGVRNRRLVFIIISLMAVLANPLSLLAQVLQQQAYLIEGSVIDTKGTPLPGVTIRYGNTGAASDNDGHFALRLPEGRGKLTFSYVGYKTITLEYRVGKALTVRMEESRENLEEVTVVAYGEQRRSQVSGSVATVDAARLQSKPTSNVLTLAKGQMAGVYIASQSGDRGGNDVSIIIRGANDLAIAGNRNPLFVIDGVIASDDANLKIGGNPLTSLNPDDIETFTVLKDAAAAAIYGSRAANGVVIITTKKGRYNQKALFSANISHTFITQPLLPDRIGGNDERRYRLEAMRNYSNVYFDAETNSYRFPEDYELGKSFDYFWNEGNGADMMVYQDSLNPFYNNSTDLMDYYVNSAHATNANLQVRGGGEGMAYSVGLGFYDETGTLRGTGNRRFSAFSNLSFKPSRHFYGNFRFYLAYINNNRSSKGVDAFRPAQSVYSVLPDFLFSSTVLPGPGTPYFDELTRRYESTKEVNDSYKLRTSFDLTYEIIDGLALKSSLAIDFIQNNQNVFLPKKVSQYNKTYNSGTIARHLMLLNENLLTYRKTLGGEHNIDFLLGFSVQQDEMNNMFGKALGAASDNIHYASWYSQVYDVESHIDLKDYYSEYEKKTMVGLFGRLNYNYRERYYAGFTLRRDASSTFGESVRWGWFPSYFVAWTFTNEPFTEGLKPWLNYGKLRFSQGNTGRIFEYPYLAQGELVQGNPFMGHSTVVPQTLTGASNRNLTWEKTTEYDVGLDLGLLDGRVGITFDYYLKRTRGLLFNPQSPGAHTGFMSPWKNMYGIDNEGVELEVKTALLQQDKLRWNISFNVSRNWNRLAKSYNGRDFRNADGRFDNNLSVIGMPLYGIYAFADGGIYNRDGDIPSYYDNGTKKYLQGQGSSFYRSGDRIIADLDGDGRISSYGTMGEDRSYIGSPLPQFQGGISTDLAWKGFDITLLFNFVCQKWVLNAARGQSLGTTLAVNPADMARPYLVESLEGLFWQQPGDNTPYPANRMEIGLYNFATNLASNTQRISYLKLQAVTVGYTLSEKVRQKTGFGARIFFSAENLFTLTDYRGGDPETIDPYTGVDNYNAYPLSRRFTIGLTLDF